MKIKKFFKALLMSLALIFTASNLTSCEESISLIYYITPGSYSTNASSNLYLQALVTNYLGSGVDAVTFTGTQDEAEDWFTEKCTTMATSAFVEDIPVLDDSSVEMKLTELSSGDVVKTITVIFYSGN